MTFRVIVLPRAQQDIDETFRFIAEVQEQPLMAAHWVDGIEKAIASLKELLHRCARAPESEWFEREIRNLIYHSHRVLFSTEGDVVEVFHIRHGAMLPM